MRLRGLDAWIEGILQKGMLSVPFSPKYPNRCLSQALLDDALKHDRYTNDSNVATKLKRFFGKDNMKDFNNQAARGWALPPLADLPSAVGATLRGQMELAPRRERNGGSGHEGH